MKKTPKRSVKRSGQDEENEFKFGPFPLRITDDLNNATNPEILPDKVLDTPSPFRQTFDTPPSERTDPNFSPQDTPRTRRELQVTRTDPLITTARARIMSREHFGTQPP